MAARLTTRRIEKVWGRRVLSPWFPDVAPDRPPVGEVWFEAAGDPALLVKYLFTSERLSVQVHPDDAAARARGLPRGKDEAWIILAAEPGATIALGPVRPTSRAEVAEAARTGAIEALLDWRPVAAGDVLYAPSGTMHAIGAGLTLIEVQQNSDTTYRLYDYGRPRELHLEDGLEVADFAPYRAEAGGRVLGVGRTLLVDAPRLRIERWEGPLGATVGGEAWLTLVTGAAVIGQQHVRAGETWMSDAPEPVELEAGTTLLVSTATR